MKDIAVQIRISSEINEKIRAIAQALDISISDAARGLLWKGLIAAHTDPRLPAPHLKIPAELSVAPED
jgi:antitoxin component of RelBE/YafQ-DinJ toxin-antitoxin module